MSEVLIVGKDWQFRALLRAQLIEERIDVEAYETVRTALESLPESKLPPGLLVADLAECDDPAAEIDQLANRSQQFPIWIVASRSLILEKELKGRGFEVILFRPVDVGELVEQIKRRVRK